MLDAVWAASVAAQTVLLVRSFAVRKDWPAWNNWLVASVAQAVLVAGVRKFATVSAYFWIWLVSDAVVFALLIAAAIEVYHRRAERRLEVDRAGRWITGLSVGSALAWFLLSAPALTWDWLLQSAFAVRGVVAGSLGASALLVLLIYRLFPCPTAAVVWRHHAAMATYLALLGLESAWEWLAPQSSIIPIATAAITGYTVIFLVWAKIIGPIPAEPAPSRAGDADRLDAEQVSLQANISQARALVKPKREPDE